ncbi:hypothetical protein ZWY2020_021419, partial [Hordeum vulgare]
PATPVTSHFRRSRPRRPCHRTCLLHARATALAGARVRPELRASDALSRLAWPFPPLAGRARLAPGPAGCRACLGAALSPARYRPKPRAPDCSRRCRPRSHLPPRMTPASPPLRACSTDCIPRPDGHARRACRPATTASR